VPSETIRSRNVVVLEGELSKPVEVRTLPSDVELAVLTVRVRGGEGEPTRSIAVTAWEPTATVRALVEGDEVLVVGHVVRRFYAGAQGRASRTEVVADDVVTPVDRRRRKRVLTKAAEGLAS
jgi:single-stranded DNA-binding protein